MSPTSRDETLLSEVVDRTGALVADGMSPTDALTKTAQDMKLPPGFVKLASDIYNSGMQVDQFQRGKTATDKLAEFELIDHAAVIQNLYGKKKSAGDAVISVDHDAFAPLPVARKAAADIPDSCWDDFVPRGGLLTNKTAADAPAAPVKAPYLPAIRKLASAREELAQLNVDVEGYRDDATNLIAKVASYFSEPANTRLSLADTERVSRHAFPGIDLEPVFSLVESRFPLEKRAGDNQVVSGRINLHQAPFIWIDQLRDSVGRIKQAEDKVRQSKMLILDLEEEAGINKTGGLGDISNITLGTALGQSVLGKPDTDEDVKSIYSGLIDPQHTNDLNNIKASAVLSHVINDPDDPIRDTSLQKIVHKYNDIAQVAPHLARTAATLKPLLRRALQAAPQPFELQEIAGLERTINPQTPRKNDVE